MLKIIFIFLFAFASLNAGNQYTYYSQIEKDLWNTLKPYFLPEDHPIKEKLDTLFADQDFRVVTSKKTLLAAGFTLVHKGRRMHPSVYSHPDLEGYLLKVFVDKEYKLNDGEKFLKRIRGAEVITRVIAENQFEDLFKVPKKWLYPLPEYPSPEASIRSRKNFILVVEDMDIYSNAENKELWATTMTPQLLQKVYTLLDEAGLYDSVFAFNMPFSRDGRIALVDTEFYDRWPIYYGRLTKYLSPEMQRIWKIIYKSNKKS